MEDLSYLWFTPTSEQLGILAARRGSAAPTLCPGCTLLLRPVFCEAPPGGSCPVLTPDGLATAVADAVEAGAWIVNLSLGVDGHALARSRPLDDAFDHARTHGVLVVVAAGNHGHVGPAPLLTHPWALPVTACDPLGGPLPGANLGIGIGRFGLRAPGLRVLTRAAATSRSVGPAPPPPSSPARQPSCGPPPPTCPPPGSGPPSACPGWLVAASCRLC